MKFFRFTGYFSQLRALIGFSAACAFTLSYLWNKSQPPRNGKYARIPVGPYVFFFPSLAYFEGLFSEIFFKETYYLVPTQESIQVIDCGANIGMSLLYIKLRAPQARVLCFEPNPAARAVLEKNIEANNWGDSVKVFPCALGKEKGTAEFFVENHEATSSGGGFSDYLKKAGRTLVSYKVNVEPLSQYIEKPLDILKMDIEGGEFAVIDELIETGAMKKIATLQLEYHYIPGFVTKPLSETLLLLEKEGFQNYVQSLAPPHRVMGHATPHAYMIYSWRQE